MSASPQNHPAKRPLEETSSPSRNDQPDAKRPALDKIVQERESKIAKQGLAEDVKENTSTTTANGAQEKNSKEKTAVENGHENGHETAKETLNGAGNDHDDTVVPDAPQAQPLAADAPAQIAHGADNSPANGNSNTVNQPIASNNSNNAAQSQSQGHTSHDENTWLHVRALITSPEAATIIGKGGENVTRIRQMSGAKCTVSEYQKGAVERILTVSGNVDAMAKAFGLIVRTINNEPMETASDGSCKSYGLRLLIPHVLVGSLIGKGGSRIKEIQDSSGARLNASDSCMPGSNERWMMVTGLADGVHIAMYYIGSTLLEQLNDRYGGPMASNYASRSGGPSGSAHGGLQVIPYSPGQVNSHYGRTDNYNNNQFRRQQDGRSQYLPPSPYPQPYGAPGPHHPPQAPPAPVHYQPQPVNAGYGPSAQRMPPHHGGHGGPQPHAGPHGPSMGGPPPNQLTQQIYIPNDMVGAIIGKGGSKINEIRQVSGSVIKINEPQDGTTERLVTITGTEECNHMALYMLYSRLESEKHRV